MPHVTFVQPDASEQRVDVSEGTSVMRAALENDVAGIIGECGGQAMCATCHVYVRHPSPDALPDLGEDEDEMLDCTTAARRDRSRLGCQLSLGGALSEIVVDVPSHQA